MTIQITAPQAEFVFSEHAHPSIFGGFGSGKSQGATLRLVHLITQNPGIDVSHFFPSYRLAKRRGLYGTIKYLRSLGIEYVLNKADLTIYIPQFGSTIYLDTYHDPDSIVSYEVAHAVVDELDTLAKEDAERVWVKVVERTRQICLHPCGNTIGCVSTTNQGDSGFCYSLWGRGENIGDGYHYIKAGTRSNKFLPPGYADQIAKNYDPIAAEAFIEGGWVSFTRYKVYHSYNRVTHHSDRVITDNDHILHVGVDFNVGGCCAVTSIIEGLKVTLIDEIVSYDTRDFVIKLSKYGARKIIVYPDASGSSGSTNSSLSDIQIIRNAGYDVSVGTINPPIRDRINAVNAMLSRNGDVTLSMPTLMVNSETCPNTSIALASQGYEQSGQNKGKPEKWDKHPAIDDWVDALGYLIHRTFPIRDITPEVVVKPMRTVRAWIK